MLRVLKEFCKNYKALTIVFFYMIIYLISFQYLEQREGAYHVIRFGIDAYIPFCEYFVIPYFLWFAYVAVSVIYFGMKDQEEGNRLIAFLIIGMTVFIVVSALFPNGHNLRPKTFDRDNICVRLVKWLYTIDTFRFPAESWRNARKRPNDSPAPVPGGEDGQISDSGCSRCRDWESGPAHSWIRISEPPDGQNHP